MAHFHDFLTPCPFPQDLMVPERGAATPATAHVDDLSYTPT